MSFPRFRPGFSFIEVLFAVILLGIGFIMIAGVFPVAIQQTAAVSNETEGSAVIRDAIKKIQSVADGTVAGLNSTNTLFPATGTANAPVVAPFSNAAASNLMAAIGSDVYYAADPRFGWVGFYRRDSVTSPFAQVFIIVLQNPNFPKYLTTTTTPPAPIPPPIPPSTYGSAPPTIANAISASFAYSSTSQSTIMTLTTSAPNAVTGAFVLVGTSTQTNMVGRFFRLGSVPVGAATQTFYLQPGWDLTAADMTTPGMTNPFTATVWIIGAAPMADNTGGFTGPFTGSNQDIAAGSAFVRVNTSNN
ncbi:MAG TPA: hypothetical protein VHX86_02375 [Tepidisphaeraceae bacterium]|nr:hypothetical protein [Tepidisphaeraceae bacterium]